MIEWILWTNVLIVLYVYFGYPLTLALMKKNMPTYREVSRQPSVTVIIAAYNEESQIGATVANKLSQNYPNDLLDIIVVSDSSSDETDEIVSQIAHRDSRVKLIRQEARQGKTAALNKAAAVASGEILVFSDANSKYSTDAVQKLVDCFSAPEVGYVTGKMIYADKDGSPIGDGCSLYMKYENAIRELETKVHSVIGVDGGVDAMRATLYEPLEADQLPDFVQPLKVVSKGYRVVYQNEALLWEDSLNDTASELGMRTRVSLRAYWALYDMKFLFNVFKYGFFSFQLFFHKLCRYLLFVPLIAILVLSTVMIPFGKFYLLMAVAQWAIYGSSFALYFLKKEPIKQFAVFHYFNLLNFASMVAFIKFMRRKKITTWKPRVG